MRTALHHLLRDAALRFPSHPAVTYKKVTVPYGELWEQATAFAAGIEALGLAREERVAIFLDKRIETVTAIFGTSAAGAAFVPINPLLRPPQVAYILANCDVRILVTTADRLGLLADALAACPTLSHVVLVDAEMPGMPEPTPFKVSLWRDVFETSGLPPSRPVLDLDLAAILYTSGSTGQPKGVVLNHRNLVVGAESVSQYLGNTEADVILSALPLSFDAGLSQLTTAFSVGAHVVLHNYLLPQEVPALCARHGVTGLTGVPPLWLQLSEQSWPGAARANLRYFANTGGRLPKSALGRLRALFPTALPFLMYGLTEAFRSTYLDPAQVDARPDSIGKAIPNAEILVVRPDGSPCAAGEEGELVHRGALVAQGYWNDPVRTAERFRPVPGRQEAWRVPEMAVFSGDIVVRDEEGFLYYVGRTDDMIKTSGYRVSPTEIEEAAYETGLAGDAVAIGQADERLGQRVVLFVAASSTGEFSPTLLLSRLRQTLPLYMVPSTVIVRDALPRSPNGKFDRAQLRQELSVDHASGDQRVRAAG